MNYFSRALVRNSWVACWRLAVRSDAFIWRDLQSEVKSRAAAAAESQGRKRTRSFKHRRNNVQEKNGSELHREDQQPNLIRDETLQKHCRNVYKHTTFTIMLSIGTALIRVFISTWEEPGVPAALSLLITHTLLQSTVFWIINSS